MSERNSDAVPAPADPSLAAALLRYRRVTAFALWVGIALVGGYHLGIELRALQLREPMGSWETVYAAIARAWPHQYQWEHHVDGHDGYGPGYPTLVQPLLRAGVELYFAHRLVNLVAILATSAVIVRLLLANGTSRRVACGAATIFYALNAGSYSIQARPDFLVLLEITGLLALGEAVIRGCVRLGWRFGLIFGLVALGGFFTKAYALFAWGAVLAYLAVGVNWRGAFVAVGVSGALLVGGITLFATQNPLYVLEVFRGQIVQASPSFAWLRQQAADFALLAGGLLAAILLPAAINLGRRLREKTPAANASAAAPHAVGNYWAGQALLATAGLLIGPGWHTGAYLTYFLHLLLVPLVMLAGVRAAKASAPAQTWFDLALIANLAVLITVAPGWPRDDPTWGELREDILHEPGRVAVDYLMEPIAREKPGIAVVSTGQTGYVLQEPFRMSVSSAVVRQARASATEFSAAQARTLFGEQPVDTLYLDCAVDLAASPERGRFAVVPRNELPYFLGPAMEHYVATKAYHITPYYFATNAPRSEAGVARTTIVKFVRKR